MELSFNLTGGHNQRLFALKLPSYIFYDGSVINLATYLTSIGYTGKS